MLKNALLLFSLLAVTSCRAGTGTVADVGLPAADLASHPSEAGRSATVPALQNPDDFAFKLYDQLKTSEGNLFFSPASIEAALAMTAKGARGNTRQQFFQTLELPYEGGEVSMLFFYRAKKQKK